MEIDARVKECPICGYEFPSSGRALRWAAILLAVLALFYFLSVTII